MPSAREIADEINKELGPWKKDVIDQLAMFYDQIHAEIGELQRRVSKLETLNSLKRIIIAIEKEDGEEKK